MKGDKRQNVLDAARIELGMKRFLEQGGFHAFTTTFEDLHGLKQLPGLAVQRLMQQGALLHQTLYCQTRQLFQTMEIFKCRGKGVEATLFQEAFHPQFNARRVQHVLAFVTLHGAGRQ